jgi:hypothetical protein
MRTKDRRPRRARLADDPERTDRTMPTTIGPAAAAPAPPDLASSPGRLHAVELHALAAALGCTPGELGPFLRAGVEAGALLIRSGPAGAYVLLGPDSAYRLGLAGRPGRRPRAASKAVRGCRLGVRPRRPAVGRGRRHPAWSPFTGRR